MNKLLLLVCLSFFFNCKKNNETILKTYPRNIGDISFDVTKDNVDFVTCNGDDKIYQYFNTGDGLDFKGEKYSINNTFKEKYVPVNNNESGLIRVRFIVNCKAQTGRFRILQMDNQYKEKQFDPRITNQLLEITKNLSGWKIKEYHGSEIDYYQYLIFKIEKGEIIEILP